MGLISCRGIYFWERIHFLKGYKFLKEYNFSLISRCTYFGVHILRTGCRGSGIPAISPATVPPIRNIVGRASERHCFTGEVSGH